MFLWTSMSVVQRIRVSLLPPLQMTLSFYSVCSGYSQWSRWRVCCIWEQGNPAGWGVTLHFSPGLCRAPFLFTGLFLIDTRSLEGLPSTVKVCELSELMNSHKTTWKQTFLCAFMLLGRGKSCCKWCGEKGTAWALVTPAVSHLSGSAEWFHSETKLFSWQSYLYILWLSCLLRDGSLPAWETNFMLLLVLFFPSNIHSMMLD